MELPLLDPLLERLPINDGEREVSHLAVRLVQPESPRDPGLCVLYLHGFGSRQDGEKADFFRRAFLDHGVAFCSFDFQGHGASGGDLLGLTLSRNLADVGRVHGFLRARGFERLVLYGSSMGGGSAAWYCALHPQDVAAAVLVAPALAMDEGLLRWAGPAGVRRWQRAGRIAFRNDLVDCELGWELIEDLRAFGLDRLRSLYRTPSLVLQGQKDGSVPWRTVLDFATGCAGDAVELHLIADGDHRLVDRLPHLWALTAGFLEARGVV